MRAILQQLLAYTLLIILTGCAGVPQRSELPTQATPHTVYVVQYGWHTALMFDGPSILARSGRLGGDLGGHKYVLVGWGDGEYFVMEHPPLSKAVKALVASDYPAMQVGGRDTNPPLGAQASDVVALSLTERGFEQLVEYIDRSIATAPDGKPVNLSQQPGNPDHFYQATGSYSLFNNCNSWVVTALRKAEMPVSGLNLTARTVFEQARRISELQRQPAA